MENNKHHEFSPSSLRRRALCPGSWRLEQGLPEAESEAAAAGTEYHKTIADTISAIVNGGAVAETGDDVVDGAVAAFCNIVFGGRPDDAAAAIRDGGMKIFVECPLAFAYCGIEQYNGTSDIVAVMSDRVIVVDWKTGHRPVPEAVDNEQGAAYALAAMKTFDLTTADVHFINPVIRQHTSHTFTDASAMALAIMRIINACRVDNAPLNPSGDACRYCRAAAHHTCPAVAAEVNAIAERAETLLPLPSLAELSTDELCELKRRCDAVARLAERVDNRIKTVCESGDGSCGTFMLKTVSGGREFTDLNAVFAALSSVFTPDEFIGFCAASVSRVEKSYAQKRKNAGDFPTEKAAREDFSMSMATLIAEKAPRKSIVEVKIK